MDNRITDVRKGITYHQDLCTEKQSLLLTDPTCQIELTDADLEAIYGGQGGNGSGGANGSPQGYLGSLPFQSSLLQSSPLRSSLLQPSPAQSSPLQNLLGM